jgi:hypothetical protein
MAEHGTSGGIPLTDETIERLAAEAEAGYWTCEAYANGKGWWHERGCPHVNWGDEYPPGGGHVQAHP